tara:strand:- start:2385 stop:3743 length:1359 start_codon:yes stop_codon:yes gene_type:complete
MNKTEFGQAQLVQNVSTNKLTSVSQLKNQDIVNRSRIEAKNEKFETFFTQLKEITAEMKKETKLDDVAILVCGDTGAGKSTLVNYLLEQTPIVKPRKNTKEFLIEYENPLAKVGSNSVSLTSVPQRYSLVNKVYWDCPGFEDNRSGMTDIANAFSISKIGDKTKSFKVLAVIEESAFLSRKGQLFRSMINKMSKMFPDEKELANKIVICFTKTDKIKDYQKELITISQESNNLKPEHRSFLTLIAKNERFVLFPKPKKEGTINELCKENLVHKLEKSNAITSQIAPIISPSSLIEMNNLQDYCNDRAKSLLFNISEEVSNLLIDMDNKDIESFTTNFIGEVYPIREELKDMEIINKFYKMIAKFLDFLPMENIKKDFAELDFLSTTVLENIVGKFFPNGDYFEIETIELPFKNLYTNIQKSLNQKDMESFLNEVKKDVMKISLSMGKLDIKV